MTRVRLARPGDAAEVARIYAPYVATPVSFEKEPPAVEEMARRIAKTLERYPWLVAEREGRTVGYAYAAPHRTRPAYRWSAETSVYVDAEAHRRGVGSALYRPLLAILRLQGQVSAYAGITLPNPASVRLHEAIGFTPVGVYRAVGYKDGAWHAVGWWELQLREPPSSPREPLALAEARALPGWREVF